SLSCQSPLIYRSFLPTHHAIRARGAPRAKDTDLWGPKSLPTQGRATYGQRLAFRGPGSGPRAGVGGQGVSAPRSWRRLAVHLEIDRYDTMTSGCRHIDQPLGSSK